MADHVASLAFDRDMRLRIETSRGFEITPSATSRNQGDAAASQAPGE